MPVLVSDSQFVNASSSVMAVGSGWNPSQDKAPPFSSQFPAKEQVEGVPGEIIIVEDNKADVLLFVEALRLYGLSANLRTIDNGEQAIGIIDDADKGIEPCPALLVLDLNLPRKSGKDVLAHLRQSKTCAAIPVLIVTSSSVDEADVRRLGANRYFRKPTDYEEYMKVGEVVKSMLRR